MNKQIGFRRNIYLAWMDAAAAFSAETAEPLELRARLGPIVGADVASETNRRVAIDILVNIWAKSRDVHPQLRDEAVDLYAHSSSAADRLWLHYGMTLLTYDFFRLGAIAVGQLSRHKDIITSREVKQRLLQEMGALGALEYAADRVVFSLRNWGVLVDSDRRNVYTPLRQCFSASTPALELWMLAVALTVHPAQQLPFSDLLRLPELFPFRFQVNADDVRADSHFTVQRQGIGWEMVGRTVSPTESFRSD